MIQVQGCGVGWKRVRLQLLNFQKSRLRLSLFFVNRLDIESFGEWNTATVDKVFISGTGDSLFSSPQQFKAISC